MFQKVTKNLKSSIEEVNESKGIVTIQITQFNKYDSDNDRLISGALNKTWKDGQQVHLADHKMGTSTFVGLPIKKDAENGVIESQLNLNKQVGIDLMADYVFSQKHGRSLQHSHGFIGFKDKVTKNDKGGYDFKEVKQFEYSTVIFGAISDTPLIGLKSNSTQIELIEDLEMRLKVCNYTDEYGKLVELKIKELKELVAESQSHSNIIKEDEPINITQINYKGIIENLKL